MCWPLSGSSFIFIFYFGGDLVSWATAGATWVTPRSKFRYCSWQARGYHMGCQGIKPGSVLGHPCTSQTPYSCAITLTPSIFFSFSTQIFKMRLGNYYYLGDFLGKIIHICKVYMQHLIMSPLPNEDRCVQRVMEILAEWRKIVYVRLCVCWYMKSFFLYWDIRKQKVKVNLSPFLEVPSCPSSLWQFHCLDNPWCEHFNPEIAYMLLFLVSLVYVFLLQR